MPKEEDEDGDLAKVELGRGSFGAVYRGMFRERLPVAIKTISFATESSERDFVREVDLLAKLRHPHIASLCGAVFKPGDKGLMVTELLHCTLADAIHRRKAGAGVALDDEARRRMALEIAEAMAYLHGGKPRIVHRDLKPANIMLTERLEVRIIDFGLAQVKSNSQASTIRSRGKDVRGLVVRHALLTQTPPSPFHPYQAWAPSHTWHRSCLASRAAGTRLTCTPTALLCGSCGWARGHMLGSMRKRCAFW